MKEFLHELGWTHFWTEWFTGNLIIDTGRLPDTYKVDQTIMVRKCLSCYKLQVRNLIGGKIEEFS